MTREALLVDDPGVARRKRARADELPALSAVGQERLTRLARRATALGRPLVPARTSAGLVCDRA